MKHQLCCCLFAIFLLQSCADKKSGEQMALNNGALVAENSDTQPGCRLTSEELQKRKETVISSLRSQVLEKKELADGYSYRFPGNDEVVDELSEFVKSERSCCSFLVFTLSFSGDGQEAWLSLTGPDGTKEMISTEIGL